MMVSMKCSACLLLIVFTVIQSGAGEGTCVASIGGACPPTWIQWGARCYKVTTSQSHTWHEAKQACLAMRGVMVVPHSDEETEFLEDLQPQIWINCNDLETEGVWVCQEGTTKVDYRNWDSREPNKKGDEHCAVIKRCGEWTDVPCTEQYPTVCTRPISPALHL
ncbi:lactose-binding lectin l-2-like [Patiria miniata]|uniref:C-type lectin domain-containing protein n=1 Tax=Patiria miniata TaxID=46514 RepID=A0A913ZYQ0_PATMI|nr:lactose-binding lectin l-2-like [Patiria miniata]